jgi:hypothetical protein
MTTMTRGLSAPTRAVVAATTRGDAAQCAPAVASVGRLTKAFELGERRALAREHAWVEAAATAAIRSVRA